MLYPIHVYGSPVLHKTSAEVKIFDDKLATLIADMYETCEAAPVWVWLPHKSVLIWQCLCGCMTVRSILVKTRSGDQPDASY